MGPGAQVFACQKPGCTKTFSRKENLMRHSRKVHSDSGSIFSNDTESTAPSQFDDVTSSTGSNLLVQRPADSISVVDHALSYTTDTSSLGGCIDPRLM